MFRRGPSGQSLLEYALILILVVLILIILYYLLGQAIANLYSDLMRNIQPPTPTP